jgi:outer membrane protein TolC
MDSVARGLAPLLLTLALGCAPRAYAQERPAQAPRASQGGDDGPARGESPGAAGATEEARSLGLREAITLASRRDPRVAVTAARRRAAEARRDEALIGYAPDVLLGAAYTDGFPGSGSNLGLRGMLGSPFFRHYVAGVDARWNLVDLLRTPYAVRAAEAGVDATDATRATAEREVALAVIDLFERILTASETRDVLEVEATARRDQIGAVRTRVEAGTVAREQLLQAEAGLADLEAELATARTEERSARTALRALLGDDLAITASLRMEIPSGGRELPEIQIARAWRSQAAELSTLRGMEWIPRVTVGGSTGYANPPPEGDPGYYAVGVAVALPLTGTFRERARRDADAAGAEARALEAEATLEQLAVRTAEIDGSIAGLEGALPAAERSREAAEQALAAVTVRAEAGAVPQLDVETARAVLRRTQMRARMLRLRLDGLRARRAFLTTSPASR